MAPHRGGDGGDFHLPGIDAYTDDLNLAADQFIPAVRGKRIASQDVLTKEDLRPGDFLDFERDCEQIVKTCRF